MHDSLPEAARRLTRLTLRLEQRTAGANDWLLTRTPDGYPASTIGGAIGSGEPSSPTPNATINLPTIIFQGEPHDLRTIHWRITSAIQSALAQTALALQLLDAIPRAVTGQQAAQHDYELKHGRCEGYGPYYAICDDLAVSTPKLTVVDGSTMNLCHRCYQAMRRETDPAPGGGRQTRKPQ